MNKRNISLIIVGLFLGAAFGGLVGELLGNFLPDGVVKDFFLTDFGFDLGGWAGNELGVIILDLKVITLKFGLAIRINFMSMIGFATAYYFLRYFR
ncbi:MAG: DUF4321 domain-containing protein [Candidatus Marinimicrobia bacterium]|jgi:uncharacterized protein YcfJ|nr:DUF4321 domain-containing protein [Candidatus Neomarinimicrobiota bacterium]MBT3496214.1 DUF4321 domain-containing protein [Candidatus Neomarinimicrobiota bacterium]MBT3693062.1 DUF4321 domain-containing protein [Candidatus Neomarinimicrobiota bacterium]MBT3732776.1 DUF4321 domain-containing protein [Candidatus Neomarinimicrobiota bacterium]MBT4143926.1 DUF4321 domain-containing protein [Candidatus Neomarinimicrobiota bacterium]